MLALSKLLLQKALVNEWQMLVTKSILILNMRQASTQGPTFLASWVLTNFKGKRSAQHHTASLEFPG